MDYYTQTRQHWLTSKALHSPGQCGPWMQFQPEDLLRAIVDMDGWRDRSKRIRSTGFDDNLYIIISEEIRSMQCMAFISVRND